LLYTPGEAAQPLKVRESWLRKKAAARLVPCTFLGKHLRFSPTRPGRDHRHGGATTIRPQPWQATNHTPGPRLDQTRGSERGSTPTR
jgi:hypothetical protein